ncbi:hypothetical protein Moror_15584 [Moniliophthora roreri MCA 2997]|uniref:Transmembrane protein n=1 Tax=Moniliophthora roreri (strain MCA 2997) TaxID=1381753 RepID=V2WSC2_MONRO|nr:hypothetical protein Moror_15584 [Moniliophthora roreri MCA 2997]
MPSFRAISYYLIGALVATNFAGASPSPISPSHLEARCGECEAKENPLPVLVHGVQDKIIPLADKLKNLPAGGCTPDTISPIVQHMKDVLIDANAQLQVYIDANVDLSILLADAAHSEVTMSVEAFASIIVGLVNVIVGACLSVLKLSVSVELDVIVKILGDLCITLGVFIHLCLTLVVGLSASLMVHISAFISLCVQLGIQLSLNAVLGISL